MRLQLQPIASIPLARGKSRSDTIAHVVEPSKCAGNIRNQRNCIDREWNTGDFGIHDPVDGTHRETFSSLIQQIRARFEGIDRFQDLFDRTQFTER